MFNDRSLYIFLAEYDVQNISDYGMTRFNSSIFIKVEVPMESMKTGGLEPNSICMEVDDTEPYMYDNGSE